MRLIYSAFLACLLAACSDDSNGDHAWQEQTQALEKAEDVNRLIMDTDARRRETIEEQTR